MKKDKLFVNIIANAAIILVLLGVLASTLSLQLSGVISGSEEKAIYRGDTSKPNVSLMINVYWGTEYLPDMLEIMKAKNVKCTFFVGGTWVADNNNMLIKLIEEGHEIGNHGYHHKDHDKLSDARNKDEIYVTEKLVQSVGGVRTVLFAPPSGAYNKATLRIAKELGYKTIMWSRDTIDWRDKNTQLIYTRATKNLANGDLILMHPTENTLKALERIIDTIQSKGFKATTVSETIGAI